MTLGVIVCHHCDAWCHCVSSLWHLVSWCVIIVTLGVMVCHRCDTWCHSVSSLWHLVSWCVLILTLGVIVCHHCDPWCHGVSSLWHLVSWCVIVVTLGVMVCHRCDTSGICLHCPLSCGNEYLAVDSSCCLFTSSSRRLHVAWLNTSQGVEVNRSARK